LALPAGQPAATLADERLVAVRPLGDELARVRRLGNCVHFLLARARLAVRNVLEHAIVNRCTS